MLRPRVNWTALGNYFVAVTKLSKEFNNFLRKNWVMHITSAPYHPASNGMAERAVRIVKKGLLKMKVGTIRKSLDCCSSIG